VALWLATVAVYARVAQFAFVNFDDPDYVTANPHVRAGLTAAGVKWAFTSVEAANWFPLTWLSHMLDCQLFGLRSGWHHLTNLWIHALAVLLLFAFLERATGARWRSAFVAFLFALHPVHVESVAWIAERKDVLSAFFWFLTLWGYVRYTERPGWRRYALVMVVFGLGLMAKPMLVTLPFVLLLLDLWPLRRRPMLREKAPLFAMSAAAAVATYLAQSGSGAVQPFPLGLRIENSLVSYVVYIAKTFWPVRLAVFYPYPEAVPLWQAALCGLAIVSASLLAVRRFRAYPYLAVGWFWFLGTLVPVIGLVQAGAQARADRYMYIPMTGLAILLAWGAADLVRRKTALATLGAAACAVCVPLTWAQTGHWANSRTLFEQALEVTNRNYLAHHNLGVALADMPGRLPDAIAEYQAALQIKPDSARVHTDLGNALVKMPGGLPGAIAQYRAALRIEPDSAIPHNDLGNALAATPDGLPQAIQEYQTALRLKPDYPEAHNNLGSALANMGRWPEAADEYQAALRIAPDYSEARVNLVHALAEARIDPNSAEAHYNQGIALAKIENRSAEAIEQFEAALRINPEYADAHNNLGVVLTRVPGREREALGHFEAAVRIRPGYGDAQYNLGAALAEIPGRMPEAIVHLEAALRIKPDPELQAVVERMRNSRR
jgi:tetratricopeptide (TPR) repeat protein